MVFFSNELELKIDLRTTSIDLSDTEYNDEQLHAPTAMVLHPLKPWAFLEEGASCQLSVTAVLKGTNTQNTMTLQKDHVSATESKDPEIGKLPGKISKGC